MKITRFILISTCFLLSILFFSYIVAAIHDLQTLKDILTPFISGLLTAFTFCFSLTFLVFNTAIQRFGRGSYDLLDKKPLLALVIVFFGCLLLSVQVAFETSSQRFTGQTVMWRIALLSNFLFFASIVPYFFWLIDHVSSKSMLQNVLRNLEQAIQEKDIQKGEQYLKVLGQTVLRIIDENDYESFDFFVKSACKAQSKLVDIFCKTRLDSNQRKILTYLWHVFTTSMEVIAEKASEKDVSYLEHIRYFYSNKLEAIYSSEKGYGTLSPTFSDSILEFELNAVGSFLWCLIDKVAISNRFAGQKYLESFFEQSFTSFDVIQGNTMDPENILDYFFVISKAHKAIDLLLDMFEMNIQMYPYILKVDQTIASDIRSAIAKIIDILPEESMSLVEAIVMRQGLRAQAELDYELQNYASELLDHLSTYLANIRKREKRRGQTN